MIQSAAKAETEERKAAFLADILADPSDDAVRLIFADWLEDHGEPERAEFIRVQMELESGGDCLYVHQRNPDLRDCDRCRLKDRERDLFDDHGDPWLPRVPGMYLVIWLRANLSCRTHPYPGGSAWLSVRRGFGDGVVLTQQDFLRHALTLFEAAPVTSVVLAGMRPGPSALDGGPACHWWSLSPGYNDPIYVPTSNVNVHPDIAAHLSGDRRHRAGLPVGGCYFHYPHEDDAQADLSRACVKRGRILAGLPEMSQ